MNFAPLRIANITKKVVFRQLLAGEERFELPSMVLETTILPLNYSPNEPGGLISARLFI